MGKLTVRFDILIAIFIFLLIVIGVFGKNYVQKETNGNTPMPTGVEVKQ